MDGQHVRFAAVVVPMAERQVAIQRCCAFLPLLLRMRLAVLDSADRGARRCSMSPSLVTVRSCRQESCGHGEACSLLSPVAQLSGSAFSGKRTMPISCRSFCRFPQAPSFSIALVPVALRANHPLPRSPRLRGQRGWERPPSILGMDGPETGGSCRPFCRFRGRSQPAPAARVIPAGRQLRHDENTHGPPRRRPGGQEARYLTGWRSDDNTWLTSPAYHPAAPAAQPARVP